MNAATPPAPPPGPQREASLLPLAMRVLPFPAAMMVGADGRIVAANEAWRCLLGDAPVDRLAELFPPVAAAAAGAFRAAGAVSLRDVPLASSGRGHAVTWWDLDIVPYPEAAETLLVTAREVTERVLARREAEAAGEALDATSTRLRLAQEAAGVGTWEWDLRADRLAWSPEQYRLHGLDAARDPPPTAAAWFAMVHEEDRPLLHAAAEDGFRNARGRYQVEFRFRRADTGEERWLLSRGRVTEADAQGRPVRILGVNLDITDHILAERRRGEAAEAAAAAERARLLALIENPPPGVAAPVALPDSLPGDTVRGGIQADATARRHAEAALQAERDRLDFVLRASGAGAWEVDLATGAMECTAQCRVNFGVAPEEAFSRYDHVLARIHPEDLAAQVAAAAQALETGGEYRAEYRVVLPDGATRWILAVGRALPPGDGAGEGAASAPAAARMAGITLDITALKNAEHAAAEAAARLARAQRIGRLGGFELDLREGIPAAVNLRSAECMAIQGAEPRAATESHADWVRRLHPEDRARAEACFLEAVSDASGAIEYAQEYRIVTPGGETRWISARAEIERDPTTGRATRMLGAHVDVTALKQAEEQARRSAGLLQAVMDGTPDLVWAKDSEGRITLANGAALASLGGGDPARVIGRGARELIPDPEQAARVMANDARIIAAGRAEQVEEAFGDRVFQTVKAPLRDGEGRIVGVVGVSHDVTALKATQAALAEREATLRLFIDLAPAGIAMFDTEMRYLAVSRRFLADYGFPPEAAPAFLAGRSHYDLFPGMPARWREVHRRVLAGETLSAEDDPFPRPDGRTDWIRWQMAPWRRADGTIGGALLFSEVVTARIEAERALRAAAEGNARLAAIVASTPDAIISFDAVDGRIRSWNAAAEALFGWTAAEAVGAPVGLLVPPDVAAVEPTGVFRRVVGGERVQQEEAVRQARDGTRIPVSITAARMVDAEGRVLGVSGIFRDLRAQKSAEAALRESEALLRLSQQAGGIGSFMRDLGAGTVTLSEGYRSLFGLPAGTAVLDEAAWAALVHPEDRARVASRRATFEPGATEFAAEYRIIRPSDGAVRHVEARARCERDPATGRPLRVYGLHLDVTERRAAERAALLVHAFTDRSNDLFALTDAATVRFIHVNETFAAAIGMTPGELAGLAASELDPDWTLERCRALATRLATGETVPPYESTIRRRDGTRFPVEISSTLVEHEGQRLLGHVLRDITERKAADAALAASEARYRSFVEASSPIVWTMTPDGQVGEPIPAWQAYTGQSHAEARGHGFLDAIHPEDRPAVVAAWQHAVARQHIYQVEYRLRRHDGAWRCVLARGAPVRDPEGRLLEWIGTCTDVTEQREAEAALREGEARLRRAHDELAALYASVPVGLALVDRALRFRSVNAALAAINGQPVEAHLGRTVAEVLPALWPAIEPLYRAVLDRGEAMEDVAVSGLTPGTGEERHWRVSYLPVRDAAGEVWAVSVAVRDVTERHRAEAALRESEARFRALAEAAPQIVFSTPPDGVTDFINARWYEFSGQAPGAGLGTGWAEALHPEERKATFAIWQDAVATGRPFEYEHRFRRADGVYRWFLTRAVPLRDEAEGAITRWFGTATDISDIIAAREVAARQAEELERRVGERTRALREAAAELSAEMRRREEAQAALLQSQKLEALGQLTGGVAHDFNNVLAAVIGSYRLIRKRAEADAKMIELVGHGERAAERATKLIRQLMAFARKEDLRPVATDLGGVLRQAEDMVRHTAGSHVQCGFQAAEPVWPVIIDPVRLETVLLNLAANARDAMPEGGVLTVAVRNARPEEVPPDLPHGRDHVLLAVADTGAGMDAETLRRATEPFFTTKPLGKGTGLGLASAHGFAAQSGGALRLRSAPGEGTVVELFLPRAAVLPGAAAAPDAGPAGNVLDPARHGNATILVVDDDDGVRPVTAAILRGLGYRVIEAPSAEAAEALAHADPGGIDMLVADVVMGGASGPALAARLRAEWPALPVLYITGNAGGVALGDAPVLAKPFGEEAFAGAVLAGLGRHAEGSVPAPRHGATAAGRLRDRLRRPALRDAYLRWLDLRGNAAGALPSTATFRVADLPEAAHRAAFLAEALGENCDGGFRFLQVGRTLEERLGRRLAGTVVAAEDDGLGETLGGNLCAAYRRCAATRAPFYDYARVSPGDGGPGLLVERLVLPLSADGVAVTHVVGVALLTEVPAPA